MGFLQTPVQRLTNCKRSGRPESASLLSSLLQQAFTLVEPQSDILSEIEITSGTKARRRPSRPFPAHIPLWGQLSPSA
jgi:hypothetical protein